MAAPKYTVENFRVIGWANLRLVSGDLTNYASGGIKLKIDGFMPRAAIGIVADKGVVGSFDPKTSTLKFYSAKGTEMTADSTVKYTAVLMGE